MLLGRRSSLHRSPVVQLQIFSGRGVRHLGDQAATPRVSLHLQRTRAATDPGVPRPPHSHAARCGRKGAWGAARPPPGMTRPSTVASCSRVRTSTASTPGSLRSAAACSRNDPCKASTPTRHGSAAAPRVSAVAAMGRRRRAGGGAMSPQAQRWERRTQQRPLSVEWRRRSWAGAIGTAAKAAPGLRTARGVMTGAARCEQVENMSRDHAPGSRQSSPGCEADHALTVLLRVIHSSLILHQANAADGCVAGPRPWPRCVDWGWLFRS